VEKLNMYEKDKKEGTAGAAEVARGGGGCWGDG